MASKPKRKELIEWIVLITAAALLYVTGWHTEVIGQVQRMVLATGIITPDPEEASNLTASYGFRLEDPDGNLHSFEEFRGKKVFLNFWATWCPPCVAEMPDIHDLYKKTGEEVAFVMVSLDDDRQKARKFIERKGFTFPVYFLSSGLPAPYDAGTIPTTYVISPAGKIVMTHHGMAKYDTEDFRAFLRGL